VPVNLSLMGKNSSAFQGFKAIKMAEVLHCIVMQCIVLYCIVLNCIVLYCIVLATKIHLLSFLNSVITIQGPPDDGLTVGFPAGWKRDDALRLSLLQVGADAYSSCCIHTVIPSRSAVQCCVYVMLV
jgi:hypothetical protein